MQSTNRLEVPVFEVEEIVRQLVDQDVEISPTMHALIDEINPALEEVIYFSNDSLNIQ
jgi:hypothetical protein